MGKGRRPIAQEIKKVNGAYVKNPNRFNANAPIADGNMPDMPADFNEDEKQKWLELICILDNNGILSSDTAEILTAYCTAYGGWMAARRLVHKTGIVLLQKDADGKVEVKKNPYSAELHKYRDAMNRLLPELGLTPASRQKLVVTKKEDDAFTEWLNGTSLN